MARDQHIVAEGLYFGEGPRWHGGRLWYSDFNAHAIFSVGEAGGDARIELQLDGDEQPSGLGWMPDGSLLFVKMQAQEVWRRYPDGRLERHADLSGIATYWCNDMVVDAQGRAYVGNFGFNLEDALAERGMEGVIADHSTTPIALIQADGSVSRAAGSERFGFPNGSVITPDGKTFIVGETLAQRLTAFDISDDGSLHNRRIWAETAPALPDGICLDADGAIWIANPGGAECRRIAEGGEVLETVVTGELNCYACMLGGEDGRTLFMLVAPGLGGGEEEPVPQGKILSCRVDAPGAGLP